MSREPVAAFAVLAGTRYAYRNKALKPKSM
jgi:hypothetical protein